ncbi:hypothetical protein K469DRAFT_684806 [Zopfia rhizophila CBS 207.26]|uniref:Uncharacterized protein n=1 Tax=Zopfia rhizophila CBS 207.26 TaxID=1314779 RepID=A0A6A6DBH0_9PEZI|nr:hypothetical protein K469DRAFT_684806 [Zopfia rhizophila CBS 207.26]
MSSQAPENATEFAESLPEFPQGTTFSHQIHASLRVVWGASGDILTLTLIEFHYCDFLSASTSNFASARARRDEFLSLPLSNKFLYFQRFQKRLWARSISCYINEKTLCIMREGTWSIPYRTSEEKRIDVLEDMCSQLRTGIKIDKANTWFGSLAEKQLLLVEALIELGRLQEEDSEDVATEAREILQEPEAVSDKIDEKADNAFVKYEIAFLKASASLFLDG